MKHRWLLLVVGVLFMDADEVRGQFRDEVVSVNVRTVSHVSEYAFYMFLDAGGDPYAEFDEELFSFLISNITFDQFSPWLKDYYPQDYMEVMGQLLLTPNFAHWSDPQEDDFYEDPEFYWEHYGAQGGYFQHPYFAYEVKGLDEAGYDGWGDYYYDYYDDYFELGDGYYDWETGAYVNVAAEPAWSWVGGGRDKGKRMAKILAGHGANIENFARFTRLDARDFDRWLVNPKVKMAHGVKWNIVHGMVFDVPNTFLIGVGNLTAREHKLVIEYNVKPLVAAAQDNGFFVEVMDYNLDKQANSAVKFKDEITRKDIWGAAMFGHGYAGEINIKVLKLWGIRNPLLEKFGWGYDEKSEDYYGSVYWSEHDELIRVHDTFDLFVFGGDADEFHRFGLLIVGACFSGHHPWSIIVSEHGTTVTWERLFRPFFAAKGFGVKWVDVLDSAVKSIK